MDKKSKRKRERRETTAERVITRPDGKIVITNMTDEELEIAEELYEELLQR